MAIDRIRSSYKSLVKKRAVAPQQEKSAEEKLDSLLNVHQQRSGQDQAQDTSGNDQPTRLDVFRSKLREELIPVFEEIKEKYGGQGIALDMDASDFLEGGRRLLIEFRMKSYSVQLDGTVMENGIAFNEIRSTGPIAGAICSGPMLRIRELTPDKFREFICGRIALMVRSILRQKR